MTASKALRLVSHHLCPYVQRAVIALTEKGVAHERTYIDLAAKPDWFTALSPLGKVPLLLVDETTALFESAVLCEFLEETAPGRRQKAWIATRQRHFEDATAFLLILALSSPALPGCFRDFGEYQALDSNH